MTTEKTNPLAKGLDPALRQKLEALGVPVKAFNPLEIEAVIQGHRTLGELAHVSKERQFEIQAMGRKLLEDGLKDQARDVFAGLEALDPYDAYVQVSLGTIAFEEQDFEGAKARFDRALLLNPSSVPALVYRGELALRQGDKAAGLADLERAVASKIPGNEQLIARAKAMVAAVRK